MNIRALHSGPALARCRAFLGRYGARRALAAGCAGLIFAFVLGWPRPSGTAIPDPSQPQPSPAELAMAAELADWLRGGRRDEGRFAAITAGDLAAAVRDEPQTLELFRRPLGLELEASRVRGLPYGVLIERSARRHRVDALLLAAVIEAESGFRAAAVSPHGAVGLTQVLPSTARQVGIEDPLRPSDNIEAGARYLSYLLREFDQDVVQALAAYNAGPGSVRRHGGVPPYRETRDYVERVLDLYLDHYQSVWQAEAEAAAAAAAAG